MPYQKIRVAEFLDGSALQVELNAPKGNVLDAAMLAELNALLDELKPRHDLRLICFSGAGSHFSFGASVEEHVGDRARGMLQAFHGMFYRLIALAVPTVAAVRGRCLGGGMELAAFCNWLVAAPDAVFAQPEIQLAVLPPVASLILPLKLGQAAADDINLTGRNVDATEAKALRLVDRIAADPLADVQAWAERELKTKSASSLRCALRASRWQYNQLLSSQLAAVEKFYLDELMATPDANEGLAAFLEKRKPVWQQR